MPFLKQSTAQTVRFGPFLDSTDGVTAETALTIAQADMQLSKDGGAFAQKAAAGNATHDTDGWYSTSIDATDTNTVGELILQVAVAGALPVWLRWYVLEEAIYDSLFAASAAAFDSNQDVTVGAIAAGAITATAIAADAITSAKIANDAIGATEIADGAIDSNTFAAGAINAAAIATDAITNVKIAANAIGASELATDAIGGDQLAATALSEINTEIDNALTDIGLDHLISDAVADTDVADNSIIAKLTDSTAVTADFTNFDWTTDSLRAIRDHDGSGFTSLGGMSAGMQTEVNDQVSDVLKTDTVTLPGQAAPPLTPTLEEAVAWLYKVLRNRTSQTATQWTLYADDQTTVDAKATVSDDATTAIKQEIVTGP